MKRSVIVVLVVVGLLAAEIFFRLVPTYNSLVSEEEAITNAWANVENVYQRRMDLIPNLVATVKGAADFEKNTLLEVIEARNKVVKIDADDLTEENVAKFQKAQDDLSAALTRGISLTVEAYPQLTATKGFQDLQVTLEGTENRISTERRNFNEVVKAYNTHIRKFPTNIIASIMGFDKKGYFSASEGADKPVQVDFNF